MIVFVFQWYYSRKGRWALCIVAERTFDNQLSLVDYARDLLFLCAKQSQKFHDLRLWFDCHSNKFVCNKIIRTMKKINCHYLKNLIPRKVFASRRLMLLKERFTTRKTAFLVNAPRDNSLNLLCDALQNVSLVKSAMWLESSLAILL